MAWTVGAARNLPVDQTSGWDGPAAAKSIFDWAGWPDHPQPSKAARGFLVHDTQDATLKGNYKLPFAMVKSGTLTCLASGIRAAASRLSSTDIPDDVKRGARAVIDAYEKKWSMDGKKSHSDAMDGDDKDDEKEYQDDDDKENDQRTSKKKPFPGAAEPFKAKDDDDGDDDAKDDDEDGEKARPKKGAGTGIPAKAKPRPWTDITADAPSTMQDSPEIDEVDAAEGGESRGERLIYPYRVPIVSSRALAMSPEEAEKIAFDPDIFSQNEPFVFRAQVSNDQLDAYYTRMHASSLRNYAQDAADGVALQNSHRSEQLPFGHSFRGRYIQPHAQGDQIAKTIADFYVVPHLQLSDVSNNHLIQGIKSGTVRDVSVGFYGGRYRCTLCGRDLLSGLAALSGRERDDEDICPHVPGLVYRVSSGDRQEELEMPAAAWVHDARLAEVSTVYDGATPGATIMKAKRMAEAGRLSPVQARLLEARYRIRLYGSQRYFALGQRHDSPAGRVMGARMNGPWPKVHDSSAGMPYTEQAGQGLPVSGGVTEDLRDILAEAGLQTEDPWEGLRSLVRDYLVLKGGRAALEEYGPPSAEQRQLIEDGRAYRERLVEQGLVEGTRALGNRFDVEFQRRRLSRLPPSEVEKETEQWAILGDQLFPGGRQTLADQERRSFREQELRRRGEPQSPPRVPDEAYRG